MIRPTLAPLFSDYISFSKHTQDEQVRATLADHDIPPSVSSSRCPDIDQWLSSDDPFFSDLGLDWDTSLAVPAPDVHEQQFLLINDYGELECDPTSVRQQPTTSEERVSESSSDTLRCRSPTPAGSSSHSDERTIAYEDASLRSWVRLGGEQMEVQEDKSSRSIAYHSLVLYRHNALPSGYAVLPPSHPETKSRRL